MAADLSNFENLIVNLMSPENVIRGQAEQTFNTSKQHPDQLVLSLTQVARSSTNISVKTMSTVLLRKVILRGTESLWIKLNPSTHEFVKNELLLALQHEKDNSVRNKICDVVSELAAGIIGGEFSPSSTEWNTLFPAMFSLVKSPDAGHRESALTVFSQLVYYITEQMKPYFEPLKEIFTAGLQDPNLKVRLVALEAIVRFLEAVLQEEPNQHQAFQSLVPLMLEVLRELLSAQKEDEATTALELFVELAGTEPSFFRTHILQVFNAMHTIATSEQLEPSTRHTALEFLVTIAEKKPAMARKIEQFVPVVLQHLLRLMMTTQDNPEWNKGEEFDPEETESDLGEESLDRLALALGGKTLIPILFSQVPQLLRSEDWRHRHACVIAISIVGEGCFKFLNPHLDQVMKFILPCFNDPNPRVRWASCHCVGQMSTDFGGIFQQDFHNSVLPALIQQMQDSQNPRVQSHAASAIINFCEHCEPSTLDPYLDTLLQILMELLTKGNKIVQEQAITAVAAIADCVESKFEKYYTPFISFLKSILMNATSQDHRVMKGKALECISLIGVAVGKEKFGADALEVMDVLMRTDKIDPDDPQLSFILQAWARFCKCLGQDFVPYLEHVIPPLINIAKLQPDLKVAEDNSPELEEKDWDFVTIGDKNIGIKTSVLEEKSTACNMLFCFAEELKQGFYPYVDTVAKITVPLMKFYYHDGVRTAAVSIMPCLLRSTSLFLLQNGQPPTNLLSLWHFMFPTFLEALQQEDDVEILHTMLETFAECIEISGENSLDQTLLTQSVSAIKTLIEDYFARRTERNEIAQDQDCDGEENERLEEEGEKENDLLTTIVEVCGKFLKTHGSLWLQCFNEIVSLFIDMLNPSCLAHDRKVALCIFDDIVEYGGPAGIAFYEKFVPAMMNYIRDADPEVRQAAVYGIGVCAQFGGENFKSLIPDALSRLSILVQDPTSKEEDNIYATENAISAIAKISRFQQNAVDVRQILPLWLTLLPVTEDKIESKIVYDHLCYFLENPNLSPFIFGNNLQNLPRIFAIFGLILESELIDESLTPRISAILRQIASSCHPEFLQQAVATLIPEHQAKLRKSFEGVQ